MITRAALATLQLPPLLVALTTAELFFKFHSFTLETLAFLGVWYVAGRAYAPLQRRAQAPWLVRARGQTNP
jgi:hypothetical protein